MTKRIDQANPDYRAGAVSNNVSTHAFRVLSSKFLLAGFQIAPSRLVSQLGAGDRREGGSSVLDR
jgi:hypothetical protein